MKVCDSWLKIWTQTELTPEQIIHQFTMAGLEVDESHLAAPFFCGVIVAEIVAVQPHPQADKLTLCQVDHGDGVFQVVCGASNVRIGLKVALAKPGAKLPNDVQIEIAKLRGEISHGMLCSVSELGCAIKSEGIWELPKDAPVGCDLRKYLMLDEYVYCFDLTPNRGDCYSALGLARELAAITGSAFNPIDIHSVLPQHEQELALTVSVDWVPQYCGRVIRNIKPHCATPLWLRENLRRIGLSSVHPVVDVLNYVMYFLGQPMHAFDCDKIGHAIEVRDARLGETMIALNGKQLDLLPGTPLITNGKSPIAVAGVIGSRDSEVDDDTTTIFIESACFDPVKLAGLARTYGLNTDSAVRFERGVDTDFIAQALEYATGLLISIVGGEPGPVSIVRTEQKLKKNQEILFDPQLFVKRTGINLDKSEIRDYLLRLHFMVDTSAEIWVVSVPSHRFDIFQDVDLVEEILRVYGYSKIPSIAIEGVLQTARQNSSERRQCALSEGLLHLGYHEVINYAFVDPKIQKLLFPEQTPISLLNPIAPELSVMRLSLWPGLIINLLRNLNRQQTAAELFEFGVVFGGTAEAPQEEARVAGLLFGAAHAMNWCSEDRAFDFYDAKGQIEHLLAMQGYVDVQFKATSISALHPGQAAMILVDQECCGMVGVVHPKIQHQLEISAPIIVWELFLDSFPQVKQKKYQSVSRYPYTRRDISFLIHQDVAAESIILVVRQAVPEEALLDVQIFDVYTSPDLRSGMVSVAIACIFQNKQRTLTEEDIMSYQAAVLSLLSEKFHIELRDGQ